MNTIAIDCGASFLKGARINEEGNIEQVIILDSPKGESGMMKSVHTVRLVERIIDELANNQKEIKICISNEMHGFIITDGEGEPYTDYVSWQNECAYQKCGELSYLEILNERLSYEEVLATGMPLKVGLPNVNLFYLLKNELKSIDRSKMFFYTLGDYIIRVLTGRQPYIHASNAAATGLYDIRSGSWSATILDKLGMTEINFPQMHIKEDAITVIRKDVTMHFYPAIGDHQAALLGSGVWGKDTFSVNLGTGGQVSRLSSELQLSKEYQSRPYFGGYYLKTIPHIPSGRALNVYLGFMKDLVSHFAEVTDEELWNYISEEVQDAPSGDLDIDMSFFTNALTTHTQGGIANITESNFKCGNLFLSVYKQMAENINMLAERIGKDNVNKVVFSGGVVTKNALLRDLILEKFSDSLSVFVSENETLLGLYQYSKMQDEICFKNE